MDAGRFRRDQAQAVRELLARLDGVIKCISEYRADIKGFDKTARLEPDGSLEINLPLMCFP